MSDEETKGKKGDPGPKVYSVNLDENTTPETKKMVAKVLDNYITKDSDNLSNV